MISGGSSPLAKGGGGGGGGFGLLALPAFLPSVISFFLPKIGGGHPGPLPKIRYWTGGRSSTQYCKAACTGFPSRETSKAGSRYRTEDIAAASSLQVKVCVHDASQK